MKKDLLIRSINLSCKKIGSSRILFVYSKEYGLLKLSGRKLAGRSQSFVENLFFVREQKNSDILAIQRSEFQRDFPQISTDYEKMLLALKYCFYLQKTSHYQDEKSPQIYQLFLESLEKINLLDLELSFDQLKKIYCFYELKFLFELVDLLGYQINLQACANSQKEKNSSSFWFDFSQGSLICDSCRDKKKKYLKILPGVFTYLQKLRERENFSQLELEKKQRVNQFLLKIMQSYLRFHTGIEFDASLFKVDLPDFS